jgi:N-acetylneuraminic acid mutarotase
VAVGDGTLYVAGGARSASLTTVYHFDPSEGTWRRLPDLPEFRSSAAAVVLPDGAVMLAGGVQRGTALSSTMVLEAGAEEWRAGPEMPFPQADAAVARLGDSIYLIGGSEPGRETATLEYSAAAADWIEHSPLPASIRDATALSVDGSVYVLGGESSGGEPSDSAFRYDVTADTWQPVADLPQPTTRAAAAEFEGRIWLFGPDRQAFILDPAADAWTQAPRYARPGMSWYAAIPLAGRIVVVSGSGGPAGVGVDSIDTSLP